MPQISITKKLYNTLERVQGDLRRESKPDSMTNAILRFANKPLKDEPYDLGDDVGTI